MKYFICSLIVIFLLWFGMGLFKDYVYEYQVPEGVSSNDGHSTGVVWSDDAELVEDFVIKDVIVVFPANDTTASTLRFGIR